MSDRPLEPLSALIEEIGVIGDGVLFRYPSKRVSARMLGFTLFAVAMTLVGFFLFRRPGLARILGIVLCSVFGLATIGFICAAFSDIFTKREFVADREKQEVVTLTRHPFSRRVQRYSFGSLQGIMVAPWPKVLEQHRHHAHKAKLASWRVLIHMTDGNHIDLGMDPDVEKARHLADRFSELIGIPVEDKSRD